ncbi:MAG TPA: fumarate/nitrate reduction transcriptional regulator Fnr [Burkholderiaceae bacterium]|nr:fumarate/nitrate reduction transcriptional regulator Fnr [Burkholderiaceae bacterium]
MHASTTQPISFDPAVLRVKCSTCTLHQLCLPVGLPDDELDRLDNVVTRRHRILRGESLYRMGDRFHDLYAIRVGHFKTTHIDRNGAEQVTGFQMAGELLGMDGISTDEHHCNAIALEDSEVCELPFDGLEHVFREVPDLQRHFHRIMGQEITREQGLMLLLGNMRAEQRIAAFLLNLASRYAQRGYSAHAFQLRMTREDIGSYLGLTIESISRLLTRLRKSGLIDIDQKSIVIRDAEGLRALLGGQSSECTT